MLILLYLENQKNSPTKYRLYPPIIYILKMTFESINKNFELVLQILSSF